MFCKKFTYLFIFFFHKKWIIQPTTKKTDIALNKAKEYYKNNSKRLKEQARDKYRNLSEED